MQRLFLLLILAASGCSDRPNTEQAKLIADVEAHVVMPKGAGKPQCYARYYAIFDGDGAEAWFGIKLPQGRYLIGKFRRSETPRIHMVAKPKDIPEGSQDAGCDHLSILTDLNKREDRIEAMCALDFAGGIPEAVNPPYHC